ncbi:MAG: helix-turn-helix domain-containing protein [Candidatus Gastranaerophilaceae bacterium]|jgi:hypothetical protein|uniref:Helix-turn-helix domain-containing protein n=1 Tax=Candidatus Limenecus avicola TaxID=2840847 RepID=A0A9D1N1H3_9CLOT|nr:helix-turn-helix domain-containing protein [Candidatus Limenecus avicola]
MPDYLTKEEIRQWRSSLERITLEEYAKRLGKVISDEKETNDMVDMVYKHSAPVRYVSNDESSVVKNNFKAERISSLAQQSFEREKEISLEKAERDLRKTLNKNKQAEKAAIAKAKELKEVKKAEVKPVMKSKPEPKVQVKQVKPAVVAQETEDIQITFKKNLTPREQAVFEHFLNNKNSIVYAKELAQVLDLPRDYVYKYIKNLRAKMNENAIQNADNGGFVLTVN